MEHLIYWHAISKLLLTDKGTWRKQFDKRNGFPANGKKEKTAIKMFLFFVVILLIKSTSKGWHCSNYCSQ